MRAGQVASWFEFNTQHKTERERERERERELESFIDMEIQEPCLRSS
jgi:hypothetical protein